jgi:hypothetical protein
VAGFWLIQARSREEAIEWARDAIDDHKQLRERLGPKP